MFDQIKKLNELRKLQDSFKKEQEIVQIDGTTVTMNGNFEVEQIRLNPELSIPDQEKAIVSCLNIARENIQKKLAKTLMSSGLSGM